MNLSDIGHWWGNDLQVSATGDLARVTQVDRSRQRVLRRLMTAKGDYLGHADYGAGLPHEIGQSIDVARATGIIKSQMSREASVVTTPPPEVRVTKIASGVMADIDYEIAPERKRAALSFDVTDVE